MGTWGPNNLDSDAALDFVSEITQFIVKKGFLDWVDLDGSRAKQFQGWATDDAPGAAAELLLRMDVDLPDPKDLQAWTSAILKHYDETIDSLDPADGFKEERRAILETTFERLIQRSIEQSRE